MNTKQKGKLERYLKNSSRFLWGLGPGNQKENYDWLRSKGYSFNQGSYSHVTRQLLEDPGIERLIKDLIIPRVKALFTPTTIGFMRTCWETGTTPDISFLDQCNIKTSSPFLEVNTQLNYVERWGELAGVWFEEIEPIIGALQ